MSFTTHDLATAVDHLRAARTRLEEATAALRLSAGLDWASPAGETFRGEASGLHATLTDDRADLDLAVLLAAGCETP